MKKAILLVVFATVGSLIIVAYAAAPSCTKTGTPQRNIISGTQNNDVLCAKGGGDYVSGSGRKDILRGNGGKDTLVGGKGPDRLQGQGGNDKLFAVDGSGGDTLDGGAGVDSCFADPGDKLKGCERTFRGASLREANAMSSAFNGQGSLAEEQIASPATVTIPGPTVTADCSGHPAPPPIC